MNNKHLFYVDSIRAFVIIGTVVFFHILCGYSSLTPKWYVFNPYESKWIDFFVVFIDTWAMATMFFVSGYFSWPSLIKKGSAEFLKERFTKLAVPTFIVLVLLCPTMPYFASISRGESVSLLSVYLEFFKSFSDFGVKECAFNSVYCHHHLWFVELLLALSLALIPLKLTGFGKTRAEKPDPVWKITFCLISIGLLTAFLMGYLLTRINYDAWFRVGPLLVIQVTRLPLYIGCFLLGILAERGHWLDEIKTWKKSSPWLIAIVVLVTVNIALTGIKADIIPKIQDGISRVFISYFMTIVLLALAARFLAQPKRIVRELSDRSFNIYLLHLPVIVMLQFWFLNVALAVGIKMILIYIITLVVCMPNVTQRLTPSFSRTNRSIQNGPRFN